MRALRLIGWIAGLTVAVISLAAMGWGELGDPPLDGGSRELIRWATTRDPASVLMGGIRLAVLAAATYLLVVTVLVLLARATAAAPVISLTDRISVPLVRRIVGGTVGLAMAGTPLAPITAAWAVTPVVAAVSAPAPPPLTEGAPTLRRLPDSTSGRDAAPPPTLSPLFQPESPPPPPTPPVAGARTTPHPAPASVPTPAPEGPTRWIVRPGDHLWLISASVLGSALKRPPSNAEIARLWRVVIDDNRSSLPDPANPDLLYVGMQIVVPSVS